MLKISVFYVEKQKRFIPKKNVKCHAEKDFVIENNCKNSSL